MLRKLVFKYSTRYLLFLQCPESLTCTAVHRLQLARCWKTTNIPITSLNTENKILHRLILFCLFHLTLETW